jgi:hypothetical protein
MCRALQKIGLTRKKTFHADEQKREEVQQLRQEYQKIAWDLDPTQMVFLDKSGVHYR